MELQDFVGIPYVSGGRVIEGLDCWGLVLLAAKELYGFDLPDYSAYKDSDNLEQIKPLFEARSDWSRVDLEDAVDGDVVVLTMMGHPIHAGLYVGGGRMLHSMSGRDSCVERYTTSNWARRIEGVYRWQTR